MSVLIVGGNGNMGRRYRAVLSALGEPFRIADIWSTEDDIVKEASAASGVIIATPTATHADMIKLCAPTGVPILCEKPITKSLGELEALLDVLRKYRTPFNMVFQYSELANQQTSGLTYYDYYKHGGDSLAWDCIQIIGLARGEIILREESPIWRCVINGAPLSLADMDQAYVDFIERWLDRPGQDLNEIFSIHRKTHDFAGGLK